MSPLIQTEDGEYLFAIDDHADTRNGRLQWVVYKGDHVVIDRHGYEASLGGPPSVPLPAVRPDVPPGGGPSAPGPAGGGRVIRVTTAADGPFAPRMMSYWANAWVSGGSAYVFAGSIVDGGPRFYEVNLTSGHVSRPSLTCPYRGETEGWSWTPDGAIMLIDGPRLRRVDPFIGADEIVFDISDVYPHCALWQSHSSESGLTHSATVRRIVADGPYPKIATVVFRAAGYLATPGTLLHFPAQGTLDESALVGDDWVVIKETPDGQPVNNNDNRVIHLRTRETRMILDADRALGHSDCGPNFIVGEADKPDPGGLGWWDLTQPLTPARFHLLAPSLNVGYVSVRGDRILWSNDTHISLVDRHTGQVTPLIEHHANAGNNYDKRPKAALDPSGRVATYMIDGAVYLLVLPVGG